MTKWFVFSIAGLPPAPVIFESSGATGRTVKRKTWNYGGFHHILKERTELNIPGYLEIFVWHSNFFIYPHTYILIKKFLLITRRGIHFHNAFNTFRTTIKVYYRLYLVSCHWARRLTRDYPTVAGFLHNELAVFDYAVKYTRCDNSEIFTVLFFLYCKMYDNGGLRKRSGFIKDDVNDKDLIASMAHERNVSIENLWRNSGDGWPKYVNEKYAPVPPCPPQARHALPYNRTPAFTLKARCLITWG